MNVVKKWKLTVDMSLVESEYLGSYDQWEYETAFKKFSSKRNRTQNTSYELPEDMVQVTPTDCNVFFLKDSLHDKLKGNYYFLLMGRGQASVTCHLSDSDIVLLKLSTNGIKNVEEIA